MVTFGILPTTTIVSDKILYTTNYVVIMTLSIMYNFYMIIMTLPGHNDIGAHHIFNLL